MSVRRVVLAVAAVFGASVLTAFGLLLSAQSASADGTVFLSANSITRDPSTGNFDYDISVSATESASECDHQNCYLVLQGNLLAGGTVGLGFAYVGNAVGGASYIDFGHDFNGAARASAVASVSVIAYDSNGNVMGSSIESVSDPYPVPTISLSAAPLTRNATSGNLHYDVTVSASDFAQPDAPCANRSDVCYVSLEATLADGSTAVLVNQYAPAGNLATYPYTPTLSGDARIGKVVGLRAYFWDIYNPGSALTTAVVPVSDPFEAPSISLTAEPLTRDTSTGNLQYNVTVTAPGYAQPGAVCANRFDGCYLSLEATLADGTTAVVSNQIVAAGDIATYPFNPDLVGTSRVGQVVGFRAYLRDPYNTATTLTTAVVPVVDPFAAPTISLSSAPLTRDGSGNVHYDVSVLSSGYGQPGAPCANRFDGCYLTLEATTASGATAILYNGYVPAGEQATYPFFQELAGSARIAQVVWLRAYLHDPYSSSAPVTTALVAVTDPYPSPSLTLSVQPTTRDASTGNLSYHVTATAIGYAEPDAICSDSSRCYMVLQATMDDGSTDIIENRTIEGGAAAVNPRTEHFDSSVRIAHVVSLSAYIGNAYSTLPNVTSAAVAVNDVVPPTTVSITVNSAGRDDHENFTSNVRVNATGYGQPGAVCADRDGCYVTLQAEVADGSQVYLGSTVIDGGDRAAYPLNLTMAYASRISKVIGIRAIVQGNYSPLPPIQSDETPVNDTYTAPYLLLSAIHIGSAKVAALSYKMSIASSGYGNVDSVCPNRGSACFLQVFGIWANGDTVELHWDYIPESYLATYPQIWTVSGTLPTPNLRYVYAVIRANGQDALSSPLYQFAEGGTFPGEYVGGNNPSERICQCSGGDPVNAQTGEFYLPATDDTIPGVGPSLAVSRTYSTTNASHDGPFGYGWSSNLSEHLSVQTPGDSSDPLPREVQITQENGSTVLFDEDSDHNYVAAARVDATLNYNSATGQWKFVRQGRDHQTFDSDGQLLSQADPNGNTVTYGHSDGHVSSIGASGGRTLTLSWDGNHVSQVSDSAGRTVTYAYNSSGDLIAVTGVDSSVNRYSYDSSHLMVTSTKPGGGVTTNTYDSHDRVAIQTDPLGRETDFAYTDSTTTMTAPDGTRTLNTYGNGLLLSSTKAAGTPDASTATNVYDDFGNLIGTTDPLGQTESSTYDERGNQLTATDALGHTTTRTYDTLNDLTSVTDALGRETTYTYDSSGNRLTMTTPSGSQQHWAYNGDGTVASSTDARSKTTTFTYNGAGDLTSSTDPDSRTTAIAYNSAGFPSSTTDAAGNVTTTTTDLMGRVLTTTNPGGDTTTYVYDSDGNRTSATDPNGHTASKTYDPADQVTASTDARGKSTTFTYAPTGQVATRTNPNGGVTSNTYDRRGDLVSVTDPAGHTTAYTYDLDGHQTSVTLPSGVVTSTVYDADGRPTSTTDPLAHTARITYDAAGQVVSTTDPLGQVTSQTYTADGAKATTTLPDSSTESYTYNANDQVTGFTDADGHHTSYVYDDDGLMTSKTEPGGLDTHYSYNPAGQPHVTTEPNGSTLTDSYDDTGRLIRVHSSVTGATDVTYSYDSADQRTGMHDETGTTTSSYNNDGQLTSLTNGAGATVSYAYDNAGNEASITYPGAHTVNYGYNADGEIIAATDWSGNETHFTWTPDGQLATQGDPNGVTETKTYDAAHHTTAITNATNAGTITNYAYGYNADGEITSTSTIDPNNPTAVTRDYGYDSLNHLGSVNDGTSSTSFVSTPGGLLTSTASGTSSTYNSAEQLTAAAPPTGPTSTYGYNGNGDRSNSTLAATDTSAALTTTFGYDAYDNLSSVEIPTTSIAPSQTVEYTTDGGGLRQSRTVGALTSHFVWDQSGPLPTLLDDGTHRYIYGPSTVPFAQIDDSTGVVQYLHSDVLGSTRLITSPTGDAVGVNTFDEYGNLSTHTGTAQSVVGYTGNWTDGATGLVYLRARDYDPATAQFLTVDPQIDTTRQPYAYVANDPLNATDPTGEDSTTTYWLNQAAPVITPIPGAISGLVDNLNAGNDLYDSLNMSFNPAYHAINGFWNAGNATANHCPGMTIAGDYVDGAMGVVGTVGVAVGGVEAGGAIRGTISGRTVSVADVASDPAATRPSLRVGTKQSIRDAAERDANGNFVEPNLRTSVPQEGPYDFGHKPGQEWWRTQQLARTQGWTRQQVIDYENQADRFQIEDPSSNRGHGYEQPR